MARSFKSEVVDGKLGDRDRYEMLRDEGETVVYLFFTSRSPFNQSL